MSRYIDADALIADMQERYCKPCKYKGEDYHEVRCRACWVDDAIDDVDGFADNSIDIVRCRDCKHAHMTYGGDCKYCDMWKDDDDFCIELYLDGDFYCAYGERSRR